MSASDIRRLIGTLSLIETRGDTGVLDVRAGEERALYYFRAGRFLLVEHSSLGKTLGADVVDRGLLSREQYQEIAAAIAGPHPISPMLAFMDHAVAEEILDRETADVVLSAQVERNFVRSLGWVVDHVSFQRGGTVLGGRDGYPGGLMTLVLQGVRTHIDPSDARTALEGYRGWRPSIDMAMDAICAELGLPPSDAEELRALEAGAPFDGPHGMSSDACVLLCALVYGRRIRFVSPSGESSGVKVPVGNDAPKQKQGPPDARPARLTLPAAPSEEEVSAAAAFAQGKRILEQDPAAALGVLLRAAKLVRRPEYVLYAAWARYLTTAESERGAQLAALERATRFCIDEDSTFAFAYFVVGHLYLARGDRTSARLAFQRSLALDPTHGETKRAIASL